jgi:hypothetical protein
VVTTHGLVSPSYKPAVELDAMIDALGPVRVSSAPPQSQPPIAASPIAASDGHTRGLMSAGAAVSSGTRHTKSSSSSVLAASSYGQPVARKGKKSSSSAVATVRQLRNARSAGTVSSLPHRLFPSLYSPPVDVVNTEVLHAAAGADSDEGGEVDGDLCEDDYSLADIDKLASGFEHRIAKDQGSGIKSDVMDAMAANLARGSEVEVSYLRTCLCGRGGGFIVMPWCVGPAESVGRVQSEYEWLSNRDSTCGGGFPDVTISVHVLTVFLVCFRHNRPPHFSC